MVAGMLVMGGGLLPGSDELNLSRLLPGQVVACSWTWSSTLIRSWVAMAAIQGRASAFLQHPSARAGVAPVWCKVATEGDSPTIPVNFELFYNKFYLVSSSDCCQFGGCVSIALKNGLDWGAAEISAHGGGDHSSLSHFSAHPVVVHAVCCRGTKDDVQVLKIVGMLLKIRMNCLVYHLPDDTPKRNMISISGYTNLTLHQFFMQIFESGSGSIGHAARSLEYFN